MQASSNAPAFERLLLREPLADAGESWHELIGPFDPPLPAVGQRQVLYVMSYVCNRRHVDKSSVLVGSYEMSGAVDNILVAVCFPKTSAA
jgi:hypothetical protein